jgi:hypothetical protein
MTMRRTRAELPSSYLRAGVSTELGKTDVKLLPEGDSAFLALRGAMRGVLERASEHLPELRACLDEVLTVVGDTRSQRTLGGFAKERWRLDSGSVLHQIFVSGKHLSSDPEEVAHTLVHELAHLLAHVRGLRDCSNRGRYHNRRFKVCAEELGLIVRRGSQHGFYTEGLSARLREHLAAEIASLSRALIIRINDEPVSLATSSAANSPVERTTNRKKYISAVCECAPPRVIRVALGYWMDETVGCFLCRRFFFDPEATDLETSTSRDAPLGLPTPTPCLVSASPGADTSRNPSTS